MASHADICSDKVSPLTADDDLPPLLEVDENGYEWAAAAETPSDLSEGETEESEEDTEEDAAAAEGPTSVVHMGTPPPPPPPSTPTTHTTTGQLPPPATLTNALISPIAREYDQFE